MTNEEIFKKLLKKMEELRKEAKDDCFFDINKLDSSFDNTNLLIKWIDKKIEWNRILKDFDNKRKQTFRKLYEYYQTEFPLKLNSKDEFLLFIETDPSYQDILNIVQILKECNVFIDSTIETLKNRAWEIKNALDWLKFKNGL